MDNNNLYGTPVQDVQETFNQTEQVTYNYNYADNADEVAAGGPKGLSIAGLILGILSLLCCICPCLNSVLGLVGLILSIVAKKKKAGGPATGGLVTSIIGLVLSIIVCLVYIILGCLYIFSNM